MDPHNTKFEPGYDDLDSSLEAVPSTVAEQVPVRPSYGPGLLSLRFNRAAFLITGAALSVIVIIGVAVYGLTALYSRGHGGNNAQQNANYAVGTLPIEKLKPTAELQGTEADHLSINGELQVNNTEVITPGSTPSAPVTGQIYYDKTTNQPYFYDGSKFVSLDPNGLQHVTSLGGATGSILLGNGLQVSGNRLSIATSLLQSVGGAGVAGSGVASLQGLTGAVTLHAGGGIAIAGTTITNSGVTSLLGTANEINVSSNSGAVTISLPQAIDTAANVQFNSLVLGGGDLSLAAAATVHTDNITTVGAGDTMTINADGNLVFSNSSGANTFTFPTSGGPGQVICTTAITCAAGGGQAVLLEPTAAQTASANKTTVFINKTGGTGNLIELQDAGSDALVIDNAGNTTISKLTVSAGLTVTGGTVTLSILNSTGVLHTNNIGQVSTGPVVLGTDTSGNFLASLGAVTGLVVGGTNAIPGAVPTLSVNYGALANTAVQGNTTLTCPSGTGNLSGGGNSITLGNGGSCNNITITNNPVFSGTLTVQGAGGITVGVPGTTTGSLVLSNSGSANGITLQAAAETAGNATVTIPNTAGVNDTVCLLTLSNCVGTGGGVTTTGGTQDFITKYNNAGANQLTNSEIFDNGSGVAIGSVSPVGLFNVGASNQFQVSSSGAITAPSSGNTINSLIINSGALSGVTGYTQASGNFDQSASSGTFKTGSGAVSLNGDTTIAGTHTLTVGSGLTSLGGGLSVTAGLTTLSGGATISGAANINTTGTANTAIGNATGTFSLASAGLNVSAAGALSGVTSITASGNINTTAGAFQLNGTSINTAGTLTNVAYQNQANNFTIANNQFTAAGTALSVTNNASIGGTLTVGTPGTGTGSLVLGNAANARTVTLQAASQSTGSSTVTIPDTAGVNDTVCLLTLANCVGTGGGLSGSGTVGTIPEFGGTNSLTNSPLTDTSGNLSTTGSFSSVGLNSGTGLLQGTGGLTLTGAANINTTGTANTAIGNATGTFSLASAGLNVSAAGALSGVTSITASGNINTTAGAFQLNGTSINTAGTLTNVAYQNQANNFTIANNQFTAAGTALSVTNNASIGGTLTVGNAGTSAGTVSLANGSSARLVNLQGLNPSGTGNATIQFPSIVGGTTDTVCLVSLGNCAGSGGGITGSGTPGTFAEFSGTGSIANSPLTDVSGDLTASGNLTVQGTGGLTVGVTGSTTGNLVLANSSSANNITLQGAAETVGDATVTIPDTAGTNDTVCLLTLANCVGTGGGLSGTGTAGTIPEFNGTNSLANSPLTDSAGNLSTTGSLAAVGLNSGTGLLQGTGGLTLIGTTSINATGTANTSIGNATGTFAVTSAGLNITAAGAVTEAGALTVNNTSYINTNSTVALNVEQNGVHNNVLTVDTTNAAVGINQAPVTGVGLSVTGSIVGTNTIQGANFTINASSTANGLNKNYTVGTGGVTINDVVVLANDGGNSRVIDTTTSHDTRVMGVAFATATSGNPDAIVIAGNAQVTADTGAVAIGDQLVTSTTSGQVTVDNNATTGILGYATTAKAGGSSGLVGVYVHPVNGVANPVIPGNLTVQGVGTSSFAGNINTTAGAFQLNGTSINTAGTLTNVAYQNQANNFTIANNQFTAAGTALSVTNNASIGGTLTVGTPGTGTGSLVLGNAANARTVTLQAASQSTGSSTVTIPDTAGVNDTVCLLTLANCVGTGGGVSTAGGTAGTIPVFTGGSAIGDSLLSQSGGTVTANGNFNLTTGNQYQINGIQIASSNLSNDSNLAKLNASQTFTGSTNTFENASNSTTAFQIQNAGGVSVLTVDTSDQRLSVGTAGTAVGQLYVGGLIPTSPVGTFGSTIFYQGGIVTSGDYNYSIDHGGNLRIMDISDPSNPTVMSTTNFGGFGNGNTTIIKQGNHLYINKPNNTNALMLIIDITNPAAPTLAGLYDSGSCDDSHALAVQGRFAYLSCINGANNYLQTIDISNPTNPVAYGSPLSLAGDPAQVTIEGNYLYSVYEVTSGTAMEDISIENPASLSVVGSIPVGTNTSGLYGSSGIAIGNRYAYVSDGGASPSNGRVVDISDPTNPAVVGSFAVGSGAGDLDISGNRLYVYNESAATISVDDITTPLSAGNVGTISSMGNGQGMTVVGRYLYVDSFNITPSFQIFDLGGTYDQQLQAGDIQTSDIEATGNADIGGNVNVQGGLTANQLTANADIAAGGNLEVQGSTFLGGPFEQRNNSNSGQAFTILDSGGNTILNVDTTHDNVGLGANTANARLTVAGVDTTSGNDALLVTNSGGNTVGEFRDDGFVGLGTGTSATFGNTSQGTPDTGDNYNGLVVGSQFKTGSVAPTISSMSVYVNAPIQSSPDNHFQVGIYTDSGGSPSAWVASSASTTLTGNAWNTVAVSASLAANTSYWLVYTTDATTLGDNTLDVDDVATPSYFYAGFTYGSGVHSGMPNSISGASVTDNLISIYATTTNINTPALTVGTNGAIGIGTASSTAPSANLQVVSPTNNTTAFVVQNASGANELSVDTTNNQVTLGTAGTVTGQLTFANAVNSNTVSIVTATQANNVALTIPADANSTDTICLETLANCGGGGGGALSGSGTAGTIAVFTGSTALDNSLLSESGSTVTTAASAIFKNPSDSTTAFQVQNAAGSNTVLDIDTTNGRLGINTVPTTAALQVSGTTSIGYVNSVGAFGVKNNNGVSEFGVDTVNDDVAINAPSAATVGTPAVNSAGLVLESDYWNGAANAASDFILQNIAGTSAATESLQLQNNAKTPIASFSGTGEAYITSSLDTLTNTGLSIGNANANGITLGNTGLDNLTTIVGSTLVESATGLNSTNAFQVQNASGNNELSVDTSGNKVTIGNVSASAGQAIAGNLVFGDGTTDNFADTLNTSPLTGSHTISLPDADGTICLNSGNCSATGGGYVVLAPSAAQTDGTTNSSIFINKTGASGNLLELQKSGADVFTVSNAGVLTLQGNQTNDITTAAQGTSNTNGNSLTLGSSAGNGTGSGGTTTLQAAASGVGATGNGGAISITAGNAASTNGNGGGITLKAGSKTGTGTNGGVLIKNAGNSTSAFQVQNASSAVILGVDTTNGRVGIGQAPGAENLDVSGTTKVGGTNSLGAFAVSNNNSVNVFGVDTVDNDVIVAPANTASGGSQTQNSLGFQIQSAYWNGSASTSESFTFKNLSSTTAPNETLALQNNGSATIWSIDGNGATTFENSTNSTAGFQVQNSIGTPVFNLDTTTDASNLITNADFEQNTTGWSGDGAGSVATSTTAHLYGAQSLAITTTTAAGDGAKFPIALSTNTTYTLDVPIYSTSLISINSLAIGYSDTGVVGGESDFTNNVTTIGANTWVHAYLSFTTGATVNGGAYVYIKQNGAGTARTFYVDGVDLVQTNGGGSQFHEGNVQLNGAITSPLVVQSPANNNNTAALTILNNLGQTELAVDTVNNQVLVGTAAGNGKFTVVSGGTQIAGRFVVSGSNTNDNVQVESDNTSGTETNGIYFNRNQAGGTTTNGLQVANSAGTLTNGITLAGTIGTGINFSGAGFTNLIASTNFNVSNAGVLTLQGNQTNDITTAAQGTSNTNGNSLTLGSSAGNGTGSGGTTTLQAAASGVGATGNGGNVNITAGNAASTNGSGGNIILTAGTKTGTGSVGGVSIPFVGAGSTTAFQIQGNTNPILTVDNNGNHVILGATGACAGPGSGRLCVNQGIITGTGSIVNQNNSTTVNDLSVVTTYASYFNLADTSSSVANTDNIFYSDASGSTNTSASVNSITAKVTASQPGSFLQFQNGSNTVLSVANTGATTLSATNAAALLVQNASSVALLNANTSTNTLTVATTAGGELVNDGATLNTAKSLGNFGSNGAIGTAAATVDIYTTFVIPQTTPSISLTVPNPTDTTAGRVIYIANTGSATVTVAGITLTAGSNMSLLWNGSAWTSTAVSTGVTIVGVFSGSSQVNGATISGNTITFGPADVTNPGMVTASGTQTFGGSKVFKDSASTTAFQIQDNSGNALLTADTVNDSIILSNANLITNNGGFGSVGNFLGYSEQFDVVNNASVNFWTPHTNVTVTADTTVSPSGTTTADTLAGTGSSHIQQTETDPAGIGTNTYTFSVWLKQLSGAATTGLCIFSAGGTPSTCTATPVTPSASGWQRFSVTQAITGGSSVTAEILPGNGSTASVAAWGAQLVTGSAPGVYVHTVFNDIGPDFGASTGDLYAGSAYLTGGVNIVATPDTCALCVSDDTNNGAFDVDTANGDTTSYQDFGVQDTSATAFSVQNAGGTTTLLNANTSTNTLTVATTAGGELVNDGATLNTAKSLGNFGSNGAIGTAAATVDIYTTFVIPQTTPSISLTVPNPTDTTAGRVIYIANTGSVTLTVAGITLTSGSNMSLLWNGSAWTSTAVSTGVTIVGTLDTPGEDTSANGATISGNTIYLQSATTTVPGLVNNTAQTFSGNKAFESTTNSTTAFQIQNSSGSSGVLLNADTTNMRLGVNVTYTAMTTPSAPTVNNPTNGGNLASATHYWYKISALDSLGGETAASTEADNATATSGTNKTISVSWTAVTGASAYNVYRSTSSGTEVYLTTVMATSFKDTGQFTAGTASPLSTGTAYVSTNVANNNGQLAVGGNGKPTGQLYVSGTVPSSAIGDISMSGAPTSVAISGHYAYVAASVGNMQVFDISNPQDPVLVGTNSNGGEAIYVQGHYAYVEGTNSMVIVDISNPASPTTVGSANLSSLNNSATVNSIYVSGSYAYVAEWSGHFDIFNVSNPTNPFMVGSFNEGGDPDNVFVSGRYAYVANWSNQIYVYDVSNPASASQVATINGSGSSNFVSVYVQGSYLYALNDNDSTLDVVNVSNPTTCASNCFTSTISTGAGSALYVQGRYAYVTSGSSTLGVYDISNPYASCASSCAVGTLSTGAGSNPQGIAVSGRYAYVADSGTNQLAVYDVGGEYAQQLQAGGIETSTLQVDTNASIYGDASVQGGLTVGQNTNLDGYLGVAGPVLLQNNSNSTTALQISNSTNTNELNVDTSNNKVDIGSLATPTGLSWASATGGSLSSGLTYYFRVTAVDAAGNQSAPSAEFVCTSSCSTTATKDEYNVSWTAVTGAVSYNVYYGTTAGNEANFFNTASSPYTFSTTAGNSAGSPPSTSASYGAVLTASTATFRSLANSSTAFQIQNAAGTSLFNADTTNSGAFTFSGVAPASVSSGNGTAASTILTVTGPAGGAITGGTGTQTSGAGAAISLTSGAGGNESGSSGTATAGAGGAFTLQGGNGGNATSGKGGAGANLTFQGGNGGSSSGTNNNANGGNITLTGGTGGTGGSGTVGNGGNVSIDAGSGTLPATQIADKTFETTTENMTVTNNAAVTNTGPGHLGTHSLQITVAGTGGWQVGDATPFVINTVVPGHTYAFSAWVKAATTGDAEVFDAEFSPNGFYNANFVGSIVWGTITDTTAGFTQVTGTLTAPAGATYVGLGIASLNGVNGEVHYVDDMTVTDITSSGSALNLGTTNAQGVTIGNATQTVATTVQGGYAGTNILAGSGGQITLQSAGLQSAGASEVLDPNGNLTITLQAMTTGPVDQGGEFQIVGVDGTLLDVNADDDNTALGLAGVGFTGLQGGELDLNSSNSGGQSGDTDVTATGGNINLSATTTGKITIGGTSETGTITLGQSTGTNIINIGSATTASTKTQTINIGNGTGAGTAINVNILSGVGTAGNGRLNLGNNTRVNEIDLGNINPAAARSINIGNDTGTANSVVDTINVGTNPTTVAGGNTVHIADGTPTGSGTNLVTIGSLVGASATTLQSGTGNINLNVNQAGAGVLVKTVTTNSTTAFQVQNASGNSVLTVDTSTGTGNGQVILGSSSHNNGTLLFDESAGAAQIGLTTTSSNINSYTLDLPITAPGTSQCLQSGAVTANQLTFGSCSGGGGTLQGAYNASAGASPSIDMTSTNLGFTVQNDNSSPITGELFGVHDKTASGLGTGLFTVSNTGAIAQKTTTNSTTGLLVQNSSGNALLTGDTSNMRLSVNATYTQIVAPGTISKVNDTGTLTSGSTYRYEVTALDAAGGETTVSPELSVTGATGYDLSWSSVTGAYAYRVYRTAANGSTGTEKYLATVLNTATTSTYKDLGAVTTNTNVAPPGSNTAYYASTNSSVSSLQLTVGGNGSPTGQLYVSGNLKSTSLSSYPTKNVPSYSAIEGNYLYIIEQTAGTGTMQVFDISNPAVPALVSTTSLQCASPDAIAVEGNYTYIVDNSGACFEVYNIANPSSPSLANGAAATTTAQPPVGIYVQGKYAYVVGGTTTSQMQIFDISNPANPTSISTFTTAAADPENVYVQGNYAYVLDSGGNALEIINVSNPSSPSDTIPSTGIIGTGSGSPDPSQVVVQGNYAYIANPGNNTIQIFNVSNPASPTTANANGFSTGANTSPGSLFIQGRYMYVVENGTSGNKLVAYDISNPSNPVSVNTATTGNDPYFIVGNGRYAYVIDNNSPGTLETFDLGGTYTQQLEAGGISTGTLQTEGNSDFNGDANIQGGLTVGSSLNVSGAATVSGGLVVGAGSSGETTPKLLVLDNGTSSGDPTGVSGALYYNANTGNFRCDEAGAWEDCIGGLMTSNTSASIPLLGNTMTAQSFSLTGSLPANYCTAGRVIHIVEYGVYTTNGAPESLTFTIKLGGTTIAAPVTGFSPSTSLTNVPWGLDLYLICNAAPGSSVSVNPQGRMWLNTNATTSFTQFPIVNATAVGGVNTTTSNSITSNLTFTGTGSTGNSMTMDQLIITGM